MTTSIVTGKKLRELRGDKSMEKVAKDLHISTSALGMYEQGRRTPRDDIKIVIANYYGVSIESLFYAPKEHVT